MRLTLRCVLKSVLPPIDGCRGGQSRTPLRGSNGNAFVQRAGRCTPRVLASLRGHRLLRKNRRETVCRGGCPHPPVSPSVKTFGFDTSLAEGGKGSSAPAGAGNGFPRVRCAAKQVPLGCALGMTGFFDSLSTKKNRHRAVLFLCCLVQAAA